jgi:hypothetical protein
MTAKTMEDIFTLRFLASEDHNDPKNPSHWQGFRYGLKTAWAICNRAGVKDRGLFNELEAFSEWSKRRQRESTEFLAKEWPALLKQVKKPAKKANKKRR